MSIKIKYLSKSGNKLSSNLVLFVNEKFSLNNLKKIISKNEFSYILDLLKTCDIKKNLFVFEMSSKKKIILVSIKNNFWGIIFYTRVERIRFFIPSIPPIII